MTTSAALDQKGRLEIAHHIGKILNREAAAGEAQGSLTSTAREAILNSGLMNMGVAKAAGGQECTSTEWAEIVEELARADGSAGWSVMATSSHAASFSSVLPQRGIELLYADGPPVVSGMPAPRGRAERVDGGYNFTGKHQFASGSTMCTHFVAGGLVYDNDELVMSESGTPEMVAVIVPREQVRELGNWDVNGLEATASIDYEVGPLFVEDALIVQVNPWVPKVLRGAPFWALGTEILGPIGHCPSALGVSHRALQEIAALAPKRQRRDGPYAPVGDQPHFQHEFAGHVAEWQAARLLHRDLLRQLDEWTFNNDTPAPRALAGLAKQVTRYVHDVAVRCVDFAFEWSGSSGLRSGGVIGRAFRNVHAMNQHISVDRHNYIDAAPSIMAEFAAGAADFTDG